MTKDEQRLAELIALAASGNRSAAEELLGALQDGVYRLALRMLGHPQDAEDATQEILLIVLTHLGSFRGDSSVRTWTWRIAANHLLRARRGRLEKVTFDGVAEMLESGLRDDEPDLPEAERNLLAREVRLRCTEAMLLSLDRDLRIAFILGDIFDLSSDEAAAALEIDGTLYRKRLSRARARLLTFLREKCGIFDDANRCRCARQVESALENGMLVRDELLLATHVVSRGDGRLERATGEVDDLIRTADIIRHPDYAAPSGIVPRIRALLESGRLEILES